MYGRSKSSCDRSGFSRFSETEDFASHETVAVINANASDTSRKNVLNFDGNRFCRRENLRSLERVLVTISIVHHPQFILGLPWLSYPRWLLSELTRENEFSSSTAVEPFGRRTLRKSRVPAESVGSIGLEDVLVSINAVAPLVISHAEMIAVISYFASFVEYRCVLSITFVRLNANGIPLGIDFRSLFQILGTW